MSLRYPLVCFEDRSNVVFITTPETIRLSDCRRSLLMSAQHNRDLIFPWELVQVSLVVRGHAPLILSIQVPGPTITQNHHRMRLTEVGKEPIYDPEAHPIDAFHHRQEMIDALLVVIVPLQHALKKNLIACRRMNSKFSHPDRMRMRSHRDKCDYSWFLNRFPLLNLQILPRFNT